MSQERINTYEGLFLMPHAAVSDLQSAVDHIKGILDRAKAEMISMRKWDERRLAYEVKGNKRGLYFLVYFKAPRDMLAQIERDCNLSEQLLRHMIIRADHVTAETIEAAEGREQLADEIKLRAESGSDDQSSSSDDDDRDQDTSMEDDSDEESETEVETVGASRD